MKRLCNIFLIIVLSMQTACNRKLLAPQPYDTIPDSLRYAIPENPDGITSDTLSAGEIHWYNFYTDRHLRRLIDTALVHNPSVREAMLRIDEAQAYFTRSRREWHPEAGIGIGMQYQNGGYGKSDEGKENISVGASWEIDLWGRIGNIRKSRGHKLMQTVAAGNAVRTRIVAETASLYYRLVILDARRNSVTQSIERNDSIVRLCTGMPDGAAGEIISLPSERRRMIANQASSELYAAKAELPAIDADIFITRNTLNRLLGRTGGDIARASIDEVYRQSMFRDSISVGIPSQLLRNRPDIIAAEEQLQSDWHMAQAARAAMYPRLTLSGDVGLETDAIRHWFDAPQAILYRIIGGLAQPLLRRGELRMQRQVSQITQSISFIRLRDAVISAQCEVSNCMMRYSSARQRAMMLYNQVTELHAALDRARRFMTTRSGSYLDVWSAQTRLLKAEENLYEAMLAMFDQRIALYRELGGGWR